MYRLLQAEESDIPFMSELILDGARNGHFRFDPTDVEVAQQAHEEVCCMVREGRRLARSERARGVVVEADGRRVACAVLTDMEGGVDGYELYVFAVDPQFRDQGVGRWLLDALLERCRPVDLYVRCTRASESMFAMLQRRGFEHLDTVDGEIRVLRRRRAGASPPR